MAMDLRIEEDLTTKNIIIFDCVGVTINHIMQYTPMLLKKFDSCLVRNYNLAVVISSNKIIYII